MNAETPVDAAPVLSPTCDPLPPVTSQVQLTPPMADEHHTDEDVRTTLQDRYMSVRSCVLPAAAEMSMEVINGSSCPSANNENVSATTMECDKLVTVARIVCDKLVPSVCDKLLFTPTTDSPPDTDTSIYSSTTGTSDGRPLTFCGWPEPPPDDVAPIWPDGPPDIDNSDSGPSAVCDLPPALTAVSGDTSPFCGGPVAPPDIVPPFWPDGPPDIAIEATPTLPGVETDAEDASDPRFDSNRKPTLACGLSAHLTDTYAPSASMHLHPTLQKMLDDFTPSNVKWFHPKPGDTVRYATDQRAIRLRTTQDALSSCEASYTLTERPSSILPIEELADPSPPLEINQLTPPSEEVPSADHDAGHRLQELLDIPPVEFPVVPLGGPPSKVTFDASTLLRLEDPPDNYAPVRLKGPPDKSTSEVVPGRREVPPDLFALPWPDEPPDLPSRTSLYGSKDNTRITTRGHQSSSSYLHFGYQSDTSGLDPLGLL